MIALGSMVSFKPAGGENAGDAASEGLSIPYRYHQCY